MTTLVLASASTARAALLRNAGVAVECLAARIDEEAARQSFDAEGMPPRDQADALAEMKAARVAARRPEALVIGCDQVLEFQGRVIGKPADVDAARAQLQMLRNQSHKLLSAVVLYDQGRPVWRHIGEVRLTMRDMSDGYLAQYIVRNGSDLLDTVGGYKLEAEGARLFSRVEGDYFTVLGLPLIPLLGYLGERGFIPA